MSFVSDKVNNLPPYLFSEIQQKKRELQANGVDVVDLGIGAPDLPTPEFIIDRLTEESKVAANHRYSTYSGIKEFREAVAHFYQRQYDVELDPETEVLAVIGSKEGIANLMHAAINPGDTVLVPDPGYPVYGPAVHLAGGKRAALPLDDTNGYVPLYDQVDDDSIDQAKLILLNYPGNPTAATASYETFLEAIAFAESNKLLLVHDAAYDMITFNGYESPSVMQVPGAKAHAVEFGSLSKSFNMTGWRIGYVVGNKEVIKALAAFKSNIDSSQFIPIQKAAAAALRSDFLDVEAHNAIYQKRMEKLYAGFRKLGIEADKPNGTIFLWAKVPDGFTSVSFANKLLHEAGVIVTPGNAFGSLGEGYFRVALTVPAERLEEVIERMKQLDLKEVTR
ncbi:LL-diaminopimelate aminotransferase [Lentibacillus sp. CBA3610]|uniref:LL-diaminopimelate aminotransferase n=1 Tax=Lentibacillus sp. CBA3610 TaxID=2518176 RepID=UPI0015963A2A|nr:LL-diaminopimelate aminotransferase [Lentibacillus sp. CBA3610]QKY71521.1 aminotransferase class I/II-fold pyridoxal phosphate-dependent enzyme [Lentibacillus sp. CBA3610]